LPVSACSSSARGPRIVGIVVAILYLVHIPFGTIVGIYGLWVLFNKDTESLFSEASASA
jgi:hypothetical protein